LNFGVFWVLVVGVLVGVAFFTLFERKLLGYIQLRKGPNKVGFVGILQPFADAIKLFSKEHVRPSYSNYFAFLIAPVTGLILSLFVWVRIPFQYIFLSFNFSVIFFLCIISLNVYRLLASGWSSNSKYSLLGALRGVAQTISYEIRLVLVLLTPIVILCSFDWLTLSSYQEKLWFIFVFPVRALIWFISCLAETNRTPFDFAEGESELVSGYNTEYSRGGFALIMLAEYTSILFISFLFTSLFLGGSGELLIPFLGLAFGFVWVRGTLPRFRYDKLIYLAWKSFLPFSLNFLVLVVGVFLIILYRLKY